MPEFNVDVVEEFRNTGGQVGGRFKDLRILLLTTTGRRTGQPRLSPLAYSTDGDDLLVLASSGGTDHHPSWYLNLVDDPRVEVEVGTERFLAEARVVPDGEERKRLLARHVDDSKRFSKYLAKTDRVFPLVRLVRTGGQSSGPEGRER